MLLARRLPTRAWWWRAPILGTLNMGLFFCLLYVSAQLLPAGVAASMCCVSPFTITAFAWIILRQRPSGRLLFAAAAGVAGVLLIVGTSTQALNLGGVLASVVAMTLSSAGAVLMRRWDDGTPVLAVTSWQLVFGGVELAVLAVLFEGPPPHLQLIEVGAFAYLSLAATALAFTCWFVGFRHLPAAAVGVIGLLNPIVGVALGFFLAGETLSPLQMCGIALIVGSVGVANAPSSRARRPRDAGDPSGPPGSSLRTRALDERGRLEVNPPS